MASRWEEVPYSASSATSASEIEIEGQGGIVRIESATSASEIETEHRRVTVSVQHR